MACYGSLLCVVAEWRGLTRELTWGNVPIYYSGLEPFYGKELHDGREGEHPRR